MSNAVSHTKAGSFHLLSTYRVKSFEDAEKALNSDNRRIVWVVGENNIAEYIVRGIAHRRITRKAGLILCPRTMRSPLLPALERRFQKVAFPSSLLPNDELDAVLNADDRAERFVGGTVDKPSMTITLWRGDLEPLIVPFDAFRPTANGIRPRFEDFSVTDHGATLKFGDYEASAESVLYEFDAETRRRWKQHRVAHDRSLGSSIRRLRMHRQLTQHDFQKIDAKTIGRIETGQVKKPHPDTLRIIAKTLGVLPEELATF